MPRRATNVPNERTASCAPRTPRCCAEIGALVRNERAKRGMTRERWPSSARPPSAISRRSNCGAGNPSVLVLDAIARALDLDPIDLLPGGDRAARPAPAAARAANRADAGGREARPRHRAAARAASR